MVDWILEKLPVVIFVVVFLGQVVRGLLRSRAERSEPPRHNELEEQRRAAEVQDEIRRKIAERRAGRTPQPVAREASETREPAPPVIVRRDPTSIPLPEPFGGPLKRLLEELERKAQPVPRPEPPPIVVANAERRGAEMERQERLAAELRSLEEARLLAQRRVANIAAAKDQEARSQGGLRAAARGRVLDDLRDPESLRRAFVLREVLGTPVGLR